VTKFSIETSLKKILLTFGIASSLLYIAIDIFGGMQGQGYSYASQAVSETRAVGAPSRPLVVPLSFIYSLLVIAFGVGIWRSAGQKRTLRITGGLLIAIEIAGLVTTLFFPMHMRGDEKTITDTMHKILTGVSSLFILLAIGLAAPRIEANLLTPWLGVTERISIFSYMLWVVVLSILLLQSRNFQIRIEIT